MSGWSSPPRARLPAYVAGMLLGGLIGLLAVGDDLSDVAWPALFVGFGAMFVADAAWRSRHR